jgi:hypothetical protein
VYGLTRTNVQNVCRVRATAGEGAFCGGTDAGPDRWALQPQGIVSKTCDHLENTEHKVKNMPFSYL